MKETTKYTQRAGNFLHGFNLVNALTYGATVALLGKQQEAGGHKIFDEEWLNLGFCLPRPNVPFMTTHDISGYVMIVISLLGFCLWYANKDKRGMETANKLAFWALVGAIGHGFGHIVISAFTHHGLIPDDGSLKAIDEFFEEDASWVTFAKHVPNYFILWIPLVRSYMMNSSKNRVALVAFVVMMGAICFVPLRFGFAYTQTVLFAGMSLDQLSLPSEQKNFEYFLWPLVTVLPSNLISWLECTSCTTSWIMKQFGGHVVFDGYMASSYVLFYWLCMTKVKNDEFVTSKMKKV